MRRLNGIVAVAFRTVLNPKVRVTSTDAGNATLLDCHVCRGKLGLPILQCSSTPVIVKTTLERAVVRCSRYGRRGGMTGCYCPPGRMWVRAAIPANTCWDGTRIARGRSCAICSDHKAICSGGRDWPIICIRARRTNRIDGLYRGCGTIVGTSASLARSAIWWCVELIESTTIEATTGLGQGARTAHVAFSLTRH